MSTRLDTSPQARLRLLASQLRLPASTVDDALAIHRNDWTSCEKMLRNLSGARRVGSSSLGSSSLSREDRLRKCAAALTRAPDGTPTVAAVDVLFTSLSKVVASPLNERLRKVNLAAFKKVVPHSAGVELLHTAGYEPMHGHLVLQKHDPALLASALSALSEAKTLSSYIDAKKAKDAAHARKQASEQEAAEVAARKAVFAAKVPAEPKADGDDNASSACVITVSQGGSDEVGRTTRRFDSDNTLADLINFIKSLPQTPEAGSLTVENVTTRPSRVLDAVSQGDMSLFALDLWPIGKIMVHAEVVCMV